jgi:peptide/nickel transport system permease protein
MLRIIIQRLLYLPILLLLFSVVVFALIQAPPGDFLTSYIATLASSGSNVDEAQVAALKQQFGLDQPIQVQYFRWMESISKGDLGLSLEYQRPNTELIGERLAPTILLALFSFIFTWVIAIPAGIYSATHQNTILDYLFTVINYLGVAIPNFMLAIILMWWAFTAFGISMTGLFSSEFVDAPWSVARLIDFLKHIWIPMVILSIGGAARLTRIMRANLLDELNKPYVVAARAKGLSEWTLILKYPVRMAINPLISTIGWYLPQLFSGSLILATVMNLQNIGPLLLRALTQQDMYLAGSILLIYFFLTVIGTLISDVLLAWFDPRIRMEGSKQ